jgi:hypothetical protein
MTLDIEHFCENSSRKFKFNKNLTRIMGILHENVFTFVTVSRKIFRIMRNALDKSCRENQNTHFMFSSFFFFLENSFLYEIMPKNAVEP